MAHYWDTSCVLKLYFAESDSEAFLQRLEADPAPLVSSVILDSEFTFALHQKVLRGELTRSEADRMLKRFHSDQTSGHILLLPFGDDIRTEAERIARVCYRRKQPVALRTLDGLHLATAVIGKCRSLVTTDGRMRAAAGILGLVLG